MYPNLYYAMNDWFGWKVDAFKIFYTFGIFVAIAFIVSAWVLTLELKRKEKEGLLIYLEETIVVGKPATTLQLAINGVIGFLFGYKLIGAFLASRQQGIDLQQYVFSSEGSVAGGLILAAVLIFLKYKEKNKQKLAKPEKRTIRIWPHDRVGDIIILALVFGIIGAKIFDNLENWDRFIEDPVGNLFSPSGLTFYGGLIFAGIMIIWYSRKKKIGIMYLLDAFAPAMMIAYAVGRMGCQVSGDGDWGVYNSAYISDRPGHSVLANPGDFEKKLEENKTYFLNGTVIDSSGKKEVVTDRISTSLQEVPHQYFKAPNWVPTWMVAYTFPHNVNEDGILLPDCQGRYCRALPQPVFPTSFYEIVGCFILFFILWALRKKLKIPGILFALYLIFNGIERFLIETIRVNTKYSIFGLHPSQAELISLLLIVGGILYWVYSYNRFNRLGKQSAV